MTNDITVIVCTLLSALLVCCGRYEIATPLFIVAVLLAKEL